MIAHKNIEALENSSIKLTVTVAGEASQEEFDARLEGAAKAAQIKGFRKGKVPRSVILQKFGSALRAEVASEVIQKSLEKVFGEIEEKPLFCSTPELQEIPELQPGSEFTYTVIYDTLPEAHLGEYLNLEIEVPVCAVEEEDIQRELERLRTRFAIVTKRPGEEGAQMGDLVTIDLSELDDSDQEIPGSQRIGFTYPLVGEDSPESVPYAISDQLLGVKEGESLTIEKDYPDDYHSDSLKGQHKRFQVKVGEVKIRKLPELDDELAQDVGDEYKTLEELKKSLATSLSDSLTSNMRTYKFNKLLKEIISNSRFVLPNSLIVEEARKQFDSIPDSWPVMESVLTSYLKGTTAESADPSLKQFSSSIEEKLKANLAVEKILGVEKVEVSREEVRECIIKQTSQNPYPDDKIEELLDNKQLYDSLENDVAREKLIDFLLERTKIKEGDRIALVDFFRNSD